MVGLPLSFEKIFGVSKEIQEKGSGVITGYTKNSDIWLKGEDSECVKLSSSYGINYWPKKISRITQILTVIYNCHQEMKGNDLS